MIVLPLLAFGAAALLLASLFPRSGWRRNFLRASVLWGGALVLIIEVLSLFHGVTPAGLALMWGLLAGGCLAWLIRRWRRGAAPPRPDLGRLRDPASLVMVGVLGVIFVAVGLVAWFAPPNTFDSLNYHMSRVAHWAQDRSVAHYATGMEIQNSFAPVAEYSFLDSYVLAGSDRAVNFSDTFAMVGSVVGASVAAALLGAPLAGQLLAAVFTATLPMGLAQASSTMTDYVAGFWLVCVAVEFLSLWGEEHPRGTSVLFLSLAAGLALATKSTAFGFLLPFAAAAPVLLFRKTSRAQFFKLAALALLVVGLVNAGYVSRNLRTYGTPFDPHHTSDFRNQMLDWRGLVSTTLRTAVFQLQTPWDPLNHQLMRLVVGVHYKMGIDVNDPRTTIIGEFSVGRPTTNEDTTTNPLHAVLVLATAVTSVFTLKRTGRRVLYYQLLLLVSFVAFSFMFKWQVFGSRLLLPFFLIAAPAFGAVFGSLLPAWAAAAVGVGLWASSLMWLVSLSARPLIPLPGRTTWPSVLMASRERMYFPSIPGAYEPMKSLTGQILAAGCGQVGVALSGSEAEYPYWVLLGAPRPDLRLEWIVAGTPSARYRDPAFKPCAVLCDTCGGAPSFQGLPRVDEQGGTGLYLRR